MDPNHPINRTYRLQRATDEAFQSGRQAGCSNSFLASIFGIFLGFILVIPFVLCCFI